MQLRAASLQQLALHFLRHEMLVATVHRVGFASAAEADLVPVKLQPGESTPGLEAFKAEGNIALEAIKGISGAFQELAKALKEKK